MANENGQEQLGIRPKLEEITSIDLKPEIPEIGGTVIILQRNAKDKDNRKVSENSSEFGTLDPGEKEIASIESRTFFDKVFGPLTEEERKTLDILVVCSDTKLNLPDGRKSEHKRAVETANQIINGIKESMSGFSVSDSQLLNKAGKPIELSSGRLKDLRILEDSPDFVEFLKNKCTENGTFNEQKFWVDYESDTYKKNREEMKAEGPDDIANRMNDYMIVLTNAMKSYHEKHPGRRAMVWAVSHYDSISPFLKKYVARMDEKTFLNTYLKIGYRGGVVFNSDKNGNVSSEIRGQRYSFSLK